MSGYTDRGRSWAYEKEGRGGVKTLFGVETNFEKFVES